ncbi:MAG TPA: fibronectin type III domain-containing protein [Pyrinomonadaceae bacterium]|nr:fibronectin type III domain-containing protein [Pyrinomonadaceae bacterium]
MTTRHYSRLFVGTAVLVLFVGLLITGSPTYSAGKGDRSAPTAPTNLAAGAVTETSVALSWNASTDNSGKWTYRVRITNLSNSAFNTIATVSQSQTTYTAKYLNANTPYSFAVYAIDGSGNKSAESNVLNVSTPADTTPPAAPTLQATVLGPSQVQLTWTEPTDYGIQNNCCSYGINVNGTRISQHINWTSAPPGSLSAIIRHLTRSTTYSFTVSAIEYSGANASTSNAVVVTTEASNDFTPPSAPANLHLVQDDTCGEVWIGWTEATDDSDARSLIEYEIYVNGVLSPLPVSGGIDVDFVYANSHGDNYFQVKAVDRAGNTSTASNLLKLWLWPC